MPGDEPRFYRRNTMPAILLGTTSSERPYTTWRSAKNAPNRDRKPTKFEAQSAQEARGGLRGWTETDLNRMAGHVGSLEGIIARMSRQRSGGAR